MYARLCVCVVGLNHSSNGQISEENPLFMTACVSVSLYAHIHCIFSPFCPCMFDFWLGYKTYCLDCDKMWATTTVVWYYIVAHCGLSGHLWHCKYVKYVGVWSLCCLLFSLLSPSSHSFPVKFLPGTRL